MAVMKKKATGKAFEEVKVADIQQEADKYRLLPPRLHETFKSHKEIEVDSEVNNATVLDYLTLRLKESAFNEEQNPVYVVEAFLMAYRLGLFPPLWVMEYAVKAFECWHKSNGRKELGECFGLKLDTGQKSAFRKLLLADRDEDFCYEVLKLQVLFDYSADKACNMVSRKLEDSKDFNKTKVKIKKPEADSINDIFFRWKRKLGNANINDMKGKILSIFTEKGKTKFLKSFPKDCRIVSI